MDDEKQAKATAFPVTIPSIEAIMEAMQREYQLCGK